jgi:hypothetical protein
MPARYIMPAPSAAVGWKTRAQFLAQKSRFVALPALHVANALVFLHERAQKRGALTVSLHR